MTGAGTRRTSTSESNQIAFSVGAHIVQVDPPNAAGRLVVVVVDEFDMTNPNLDVQLAVDGELYEEATAFADSPRMRDCSCAKWAGSNSIHCSIRLRSEPIHCN